MKTYLSIHARDVISWRESKTAVLAIIMHVTGASKLEVIEDDTGLKLEMRLTKAVKSMETILKYFQEHYEGVPISLNLEVHHTPET